MHYFKLHKLEFKKLIDCIKKKKFLIGDITINL